MARMEPEWYYERDSQQRGPVSAAELKELKNSEAISDANLVWNEALPDWIPFGESELSENRQLETASPPPMPVGNTPPPVPGTTPGVDPFVPRHAELRSDSAVRIRSTLARGWKLLVSDFWPFVGYNLLLGLLISVATQFYVTVFFLVCPTMAGGMFFLLYRKRGKRRKMDDFFEGFRRRFGDLAKINLVTTAPLIPFGLIVFAGWIGMAIFAESMEGEGLAIYLAVYFGFLFLAFFVCCYAFLLATLASMICLDCDIPAKESLGIMWAGAKRHWGKLLLFVFVNLIAAFSGLLLCYVGVFVTGAWCILAEVYLYEDLFGDKVENAS